MTPPRRRPADLEQLAGSLGERDWAILRDLGRLRLLTGRHIQRLHVWTDSPQTQARRTRSILQRLYDHGLLSRLDRRVGGIRAGSAGYTYALSTIGQRLVTGRGPAGGTRLRRYWEPSAAFVDHILAVSELYVQIREHERAHQFELLHFDAEPAAWRRWHDLSGQQLVLRPDAFIVTADAETETFVFLELDRGTESLRVIQRKAEVFIDYWRSGTEQRAHDVFPKVLFVVPDQRRLAGMVGALSRVDATAWQLFQVVTMTKALPAITGRSPPEAGESQQQAM